MENLRKRIKIFCEDLVCEHQAGIGDESTDQVGFAILYLMYDFHHNTWMKKFPNSTLLFTNIDSLAYEVVGHDIYAGMVEIKDEFDFSEYPKDHFLQSYDNMKAVVDAEIRWAPSQAVLQRL